MSQCKLSNGIIQWSSFYYYPVSRVQPGPFTCGILSSRYFELFWPRSTLPLRWRKPENSSKIEKHQIPQTCTRKGSSSTERRGTFCLWSNRGTYLLQFHDKKYLDWTALLLQQPVHTFSGINISHTRPHFSRGFSLYSGWRARRLDQSNVPRYRCGQRHKSAI